MIVLILCMLLIEFKNHFIDVLKDDYPKSEIKAFFRHLTDFYFQWDPTFSILNSNHILNNEELEKLSMALIDLKKHRPLQYITNEAHFFGRTFYVNKNVLIPRPETEELVKWVLMDLNEDDDQLDVLEMGTGSGCIAVSLAKEYSKFNIQALDISKTAIAVAQKNAAIHNVIIDFFQKDMRKLKVWSKPLDLIISNPPYIEPDEKKEILSNVLDYEPHLALFTPKNDPLYFYKKIIILAESSLKINGGLYFEINPKFLVELETIIKARTFKDIEVRNDIFDKNRILKAVKS